MWIWWAEAERSSLDDLCVVWKWISNICLYTSMSATATKHYISKMLPLLLTQLNPTRLGCRSTSFIVIFHATLSRVDSTQTHATHLICVSQTRTWTFWISAPFQLICRYYSKCLFQCVVQSERVFLRFPSPKAKFIGFCLRSTLVALVKFLSGFRFMTIWKQFKNGKSTVEIPSYLLLC